MSKITLTERQYLEAVNRLLDVWMGGERKKKSGTGGGLPRTAKTVLLAALEIIREHARKDERVAVIAGVHHVVAWITKHQVRYKSPRDVLSQWRRHFPEGNTRGRNRVLNLYPHLYPTRRFGMQVCVTDAGPHVRIEARVTAGSAMKRYLVSSMVPSIDVPLIDLSSPSSSPTEAWFLLALMSYYTERHEVGRYQSILQHARRFGIRVSDLRARAMRAINALLRRRYERRYEAVRLDDLTEVQRIALEVWYRWALIRWQSAAWEATIQSGSATRGALARKLRNEDPAEHPDVLLADAGERLATKERKEQLHLWALDRVRMSEAEIAQIEEQFQRAATVIARPLEGILQRLQTLGFIDDLEAWGERELAHYEALEEEAVAVAEEHDMPPPMVQRAIRRLARPRAPSWPEREARKIVARGVAPDNDQQLLREIIAQYLTLMDARRLDGGLELFLENQLRLLSAIHRLIAHANARG